MDNDIYSAPKTKLVGETNGDDKISRKVNKKFLIFRWVMFLPTVALSWWAVIFATMIIGYISIDKEILFDSEAEIFLYIMSGISGLVVVIASYLVAPLHKFRASILGYVLGCICALKVIYDEFSGIMDWVLVNCSFSAIMTGFLTLILIYKYDLPLIKG